MVLAGQEVYCILSIPLQSFLSVTILHYPILSYPILSYPILSYPILSHIILSYPILSYLTLSFSILFLDYQVYSFLEFACIPSSSHTMFGRNASHYK